MSASKQEYKYGFVTKVPSQKFAKGLNQEVICKLSEQKGEPGWVLDLRLKAYHHWRTLKEPDWAGLKHPPINYQNISYYSSPVAKDKKKQLKSLDEADPELLKTFERLGIPLSERKRLAGVAVDAVFDSVSLGTTHQDKLKKSGVIFVLFLRP